MTALDSNLTWGERDALYAKHLDYVFSLEATFRLLAPAVFGAKVPMRVVTSTEHEWDTFHVLDENFMRTPNGILQQVPRAKLAFGNDAILIRDDGAVALEGTFVFETDTPDRLSMHYSGALTLAGGTQRLCFEPDEESAGPKGSAFIASTQDVANPKYCWMVKNRLIGVGQVTTVWRKTPQEANERGYWYLKFDYDLYIAS